MVKIVVIGSASMDLTVLAKRRPNAGETIFGERLILAPGGKGANQVVAAARLGAEVHLVACLGEDTYGAELMHNFAVNSVNCDYVVKFADQSTGSAHITLAEGDNSIIVIKGANDHVVPAIVDRALTVIKAADLVMLQQEIPAATVNYVVNLCHELNIPVLLNPAPILTPHPETLAKASFLTPNEHEVAELFPDLELEQALRAYPNKLIVTEGKLGALFCDGAQIKRVATFSVDALDTTGAGDTFNAAFAVAMAEGQSIEHSMRFANAAAALSVTKLGAQGGMPERAAVERLLNHE